MKARRPNTNQTIQQPANLTTEQASVTPALQHLETLTTAFQPIVFSQHNISQMLKSDSLIQQVKFKKIFQWKLFMNHC